MKDKEIKASDFVSNKYGINCYEDGSADQHYELGLSDLREYAKLIVDQQTKKLQEDHQRMLQRYNDMAEGDENIIDACMELLENACPIWKDTSQLWEDWYLKKGELFG